VVIHPIATGRRAVTVARVAEMSLIVVMIMMRMVVLMEASKLDTIHIGDTRNTT
jgi:hypothetical protein